MCRECFERRQTTRDIVAEAQLQTLLRLNPLLNRFELRVGVRKGCARLEGTVDHPALKQLACEVARQADGVGRVDDRILVSSRVPGTRQRHPLAQRLRDLNAQAVIRLKYQLNRYTVDQALDVEVFNDVAHIAGRVTHARATAFARQLALDTVGIAAVESDVELCPEPSGLSGIGDVPEMGNELFIADGERLSSHAGFMLALTRDLAMLPLQVKVTRRTAMLFGCVNSDRQLRKAEEVVGAVIGVRGVDSRAVQLRASVT